MPRLAGILQATLRKQAFAAPQTRTMDESTLAALTAYKQKENIEGEGLTLQVLDQLAIVTGVFRRRKS